MTQGGKKHETDALDTRCGDAGGDNVPSTRARTVPQAGMPIRSSGEAAFGRLPLTFEANHGQTDSQVMFFSRGRGYSAFLTAEGMVLSLCANKAASQLSGNPPVADTGLYRPTTTLRFRLLGAAKNPAVIGEYPQPGHVNYFIGKDPANWHRNVPTYAQVRYKNVYPGIDLVYYGNRQKLEYDFAISPGADPGLIQFEIKGAGEIELDGEGNLVLQTGSGQLHFQNPAVYQESNGQRLPVGGTYVLRDSTHIAFQIAHYDASKPLVIDPVLIYSTYLGGIGEYQAVGIAIDSAGNIYMAGSTESTDFPPTKLSSVPARNSHVVVAKLDASGSNLIYTDYLGGNDQDYGYALTLDAANNVYVTGNTQSSDFPTVNPFQRNYPGSLNAFLTKISPDGSALLYSTYFGGNGRDHPSSVAVDSAGEMILAGFTSSTNLPVADAYQSKVSSNFGGLYGNYGFLTKFSADGSSLVYSTYFGGNSNAPLNCRGNPCWTPPNSVIAGMVLDSAGNAYVSGATNTYNFPVTDGVYQTTDTTQQNGVVGFVGKFNGAGILQYSTYFYDPSGLIIDITALAVDASGSVYVTGDAVGAGTFPITSVGVCDPRNYTFGCHYAFATKFDAAGATLLYSTYLGPNNNAVPLSIVLDEDNDAYIAAFTGSSSFGTVSEIENFSGGNDILLIEIDPTASTQLFATYVGGSGKDEPAQAGMAIDAGRNLYIVGLTDSSDFPVTQAAFQEALGGNTDAFILKIGTASAPAVAFSPFSLQYASLTVGSSSMAQTVLLRNMGSAPLSISSITTTDSASFTHWG